MDRFTNFGRALIVAGLAGTARAASGVSAKYDGVYIGTGVPVQGLSAPECPTLMVGPITISKGFLRSEKTAERPAATGFITEEGYVSARFSRPGAKATRLAGRWDENVISAGVIEEDTGCAWTLRLEHHA
ncbi:MAG: hypothetical protein EXQ84_05865 [Rhodospirillaceae bacterium]|nr:hypothetical protein [Rhodospirillaceae bacterium]